MNGVEFDKRFLEHISEFFRTLFYMDKNCQEFELSPTNEFSKDFVKILQFYQKNIDEIHEKLIKINKYDLYFSDCLKKNESNLNLFSNGFFDFKKRVLKILEIDNQNRIEMIKNRQNLQENINIVKESGLLTVLNSNEKFLTIKDEHLFVKNILELSDKYMVSFLTKECEKWLCENNGYLITIYNVIDEIEWAHLHNLYTYIEFLIDSSKNSLYISQKFLNTNKPLFKTLFDKYVLENIGLIKNGGYITIDEYDPIPYITKDWCSVPEEYQKISSSNNTSIYRYTQDKYFIIKDNNKYGWLNE